MAQFLPRDPGLWYRHAVEDARRLLQRASDRWSAGDPSEPWIEEVLRHVIGIFVTGRFIIATFRVEVDPYWLARDDGTVEKLTLGVFEDGAFDRLPILGDALEDAGCADADILGHRRGSGPPRRGCRVVELLSGETPFSPTRLPRKRMLRGNYRNGRSRGDGGLRYGNAFEGACGMMDRAATEWAEGDPEDPPTGEVLRGILAVFIDAKVLRLPFGAGPT